MNEQFKEHVRLDRHLKHENEVLKTKVTSLQTFIDNMTISNRSLGKSLKKKEKQLEELVKSQQRPIPSPPQVHVLFNTSALGI